MKRILIISLASVLALTALNGCTDVLDQAPDGKMTLDAVFKNNDMTAAYLSSCYSFVSAKNLWYYFSTNYPIALSDEAWEADDCVGLRTVQYYDGNVSASGNSIYEDMPSPKMRVGTYWKYYWEGIRYCNVFLSNIATASVNSETDRARWTAEAHVLRASFYLELLKWYGACLPISATPYESDFDFSTLTKAKYGEVIQFIVSDCQAALDMNILPWRHVSGNKDDIGMRVTNAVAEAIKVRALLYAVSPRNDDGTYSKTDAYNIAKASLTALRNNGYELFNKDNTFSPLPVWTDPFGEAITGTNAAALINAAGSIKYYFCNWADYTADPKDKETIWQHQVNGNRHWLVGTWFGGYKCGLCPSQQYVDAFEVTDGTRSFNILNLSQPYLDGTAADDYTNLEPNYNSAALTSNGGLYNPNDPYKNRDPRFYATIYYHGAKRYMTDVSTMASEWKKVWTNKEDAVSGIRDGSRGAGDRTFTRTGYYNQKYLHPTEGGHELPYFAPGWKLFRLGEIILNVAELAIESGNYTDAVPLINEIRKRSAMPAISPASQDEARRLLRQERRVELGFEEARYYDVRRWLAPGTDVDLKATDKWIGAMSISDNDAHNAPVFTRTHVRVAPRECYINKYLLQPIPQAEANRLEAFTGESWQNPGW